MRVLFISGSLGLGHVGRDLAIANELRRLLPEIEIDWLAGDPATRHLEQAGERLLPGCAVFKETGSAEEKAGAFSLNIIRYVVNAASTWARIVRAVLRAINDGDYDLVVGDETYELGIALTLRPSLKKVPTAVIYDFFGLDAMTENPAERLMVHVLNRVWGGGHSGKPPAYDLAMFVGEPEDIRDRPLGFRLPGRRAYAMRHFEFLGYVLNFDPAELLERRATTRAELGYDDSPLIVCSAGGTAVGAELLQLCADAYPHILERVQGTRMVIVCGPRIDPATIHAPREVEVRGYVPRLHELFSACDVAVVQAGGTTTLELTALRRPFVYFPLEGHVEQNLTVAERLRRHGAGERRDYSATTPEALGETVARLVESVPSWSPIPTDGARRAAELLLTRVPVPNATH